ncbi:MAG TPA: glutamine-hydrolyzing carbamoyl-phosphate synthase small subunit, partial [Candidatus Saccharimonadales bacterium]|nr:glutamine-hydrolyzing carbamoyl-phosphate synthase small subunit [Candidatus Saccharimonadales bacterium]
MAFKAKLILQDGTTFEGTGFGAKTSNSGEVVFATGMVGYDLSLTDPSYKGQILTFTYPLIGNWGVPPKEKLESTQIHVSGLVISNLTTKPSHWESQKTLDAWMKEEGIPGIYGIDTRRLTQKLRETGVMLGKIINSEKDVKIEDPNLRNLVEEVSTPKVKIYKGGKLKIGLLDCGAKENITRCLTKRGATVYRLPWNYDPFENGLELDGLMISNGPGDPKMAKESIEIIKKSLSKKLPTFGICLGNQLLALAAGGDTYKLKFGHRAQNQPTIQV